MYQSAEEAKAILWRRRRNLTLRRQIRDYLGELPDFLQHGPRAVLARQLATPNLEFDHFIAGAKAVGLPPACPDYAGDKFCSRNPDKLALGKLTFYHGQGRQHGEKLSPRRIIDFCRWDGQPLRQVRTLWGEGLIDFHHRLLAAHLPGVEWCDNTAWLQRMGGKPALFWPRLMALFVRDGILFENFHSGGQEEDFTRDIIRPALAEAEERFGLAPLIVPLVPREREREVRWSWYPGELEGVVCQALQVPLRTGTRVPVPPIPARGGVHA